MTTLDFFSGIWPLSVTGKSMDKMLSKAAVLWAGGKDSSLALYEARFLGYEVLSLVTFVPREPKFRAHPLRFMEYQAEALGLPHFTLEVNEPFRKSYEKAIHSLRERHRINTLITGDIAEVDCCPNWIRKCCEGSGVDVMTPLWGRDRTKLLKQFLSHKFRAVFSYVKKPWFTQDWLGIELNDDSLRRLCKINAETGLDICGENGEYHTLVTDGPVFRQGIDISESQKVLGDGYWFLDLRKVSFLSGKFDPPLRHLQIKRAPTLPIDKPS